MKSSLLAAVPLVVLATAGCVRSQGLLYELRGTTTQPIGQAAFGGDLTGDKVNDLLVVSGHSVLVVSGVDGRVARTLADLKMPIVSLAGGRDVNGDGVPDVLVSLAGRVDLVSGKNGLLMRRWTNSTIGQRFGTLVGFVSDLDGDRRDDVWIGAPGTTVNTSTSIRQSPPGFIVSYSTLTGAEVDRQDFDSATRINTISPGTDHDGDGEEDLAVGVRVAFGRSTRLYFQGYSYGLLYSWSPKKKRLRTLRRDHTIPAWRPGILAASLDDVDKDGGADVIATTLSIFPTVRTVLEVISGKTGKTLGGATLKHSVQYDAPVTVGDIDGDGLRDYAIESRSVSQADVTVYSGRDGGLIWSHPDNRSGFGRTLFTVGDVDGDRVPELAIGGSGYVSVFTYRFRENLAGFASLFSSTGLAKFAPSRLIGTGVPSVGGNLAIAIEAPGYDASALLFGARVQAGQIAPIPGNPLLLYLDERFLLPFTQPFVLIGGRAVLSMQLPYIHDLFGADLGLQAALFSMKAPSSFGATNLLIANLGVLDKPGGSLFRMGLTIKVPANGDYKDPLARPSRLLRNSAVARLSVSGHKSAGGPIELRTANGGTGALLGSLPVASGSFEVTVTLPASTDLYVYSRDKQRDVTLNSVSLRVH